MLNNYFSHFILFNLSTLWLYFSIHIGLACFFSIHFFFIKFFKYKIDLKNVSLKNIYNIEKFRTIINTIKTTLSYNNQINLRFIYYLLKVKNCTVIIWIKYL